ncbi:MAG: mandelate racemase [Mesorhizobium sp.]|uniref:mandelate racemase/muconate lactonizing enzyme family protein n=1 Tax=unclassified Mesorhizobium TaxID=325217 RepID=UPI000FCB7FEC|nr:MULTISPECIES: mandelate racemase/muconate lactonizing enzyme family protein [unclassified Mesorhizobium]RUX46785.1 mandelate racemase [Mesorhizobium sp. M4A.F.Ca.ET.050.02.1.1]RVD42506.1 mandelate racemase [Mesorhizobium sp. M4A.F.Ca.ET.020.02.1.1]RWC22033.1 MAG: mandelate racemase [Mesorhizobium sp.]RWD04584.1 MAG: mandelate racemase [Mesorhizobium sp.]RWD28864.1 MAG: mandelate racemase [Mesorhizobium sp.]
MRIAEYRITRYQFARDRTIGDSQVRIDAAHVAALELVAENGLVGLGFVQSLFHPLPDQAEIVRVFEEEAWPDLAGQSPLGLVHRVQRPRGGNRRAFGLPFEEALQVALWDLSAKLVGLPLHELLGSRRKRVKAYASGLDFHLSDDEFQAFFAHAEALGYRAFKIKVGHPDFDRDLSRLELLRKTVRPGSSIMIDANEAWGAKEASVKLQKIHSLGYDLLWVEDPILRHDFDGLRNLKAATPWTMINSGEYLDAAGKRLLMQAGATDMLNVHGQVTDVMRIGWLAAELGVPVTLGNTFLEIGVHMACALPEVEWLEYSFQNFDHLVEQTIEIHDGWIHAPDRTGHGLVLSETGRLDWTRPEILSREDLGEAPVNPRVDGIPNSQRALDEAKAW